MSKFLELGVQAFVDGFKGNDLEPAVSTFYFKRANGQQCGCALTAIAMCHEEFVAPSRDNEDPGDHIMAFIGDKYGVGEDALTAFYEGFDRLTFSYDGELGKYYEFGMQVRNEVEDKIKVLS